MAPLFATFDIRLVLNRNPTISRRFVFSLFSALIFHLVGCGSQDEIDQTKNSTPSTLDIAAIKERYATAQSYSDDARLIFSYTLNGVPFQESHPFSCNLKRSNIAQLNWFRFQICSTDNYSIGRVFDAETQNFDGQIILSDQKLPVIFKTLSSDSIAAHFISGRKDVPWKFSESDLTPIIEMLGIAYCNFSKQPPSWFSEEKLVEQKSQVVDGKTFIDASFRSSFGNISCRIDPAKKLIMGIRLPKSMLSKETTNSDAIKNVSLSLLFEHARFDSQPTIVTRLTDGEKPVTNFVVLPEEFPTEAIGKKLEDWNMIDLERKRFHADSASGAISLFFYGDLSMVNQQQISRINTMSDSFTNVNFAWITPQAIPLALIKSPFGRMGFFNDKKNEVLNFFQPNSPTFLFVTNKEGVIQYFSRISKKGIDNAEGVIQRVVNGEDVAVEMHDEYSKYFSKYQSDLEKARPSESIATSFQ